MEKIGVYPGSFDPITNGHMDVLRRSLEVFDRVILLLAVNPRKKSVFPIEERLAMMKEAVKDMDRVTVDATDGLTVDYCLSHGSHHIIRGLRAVTDFEYEFQLAAANRFAGPGVDMVFFMSGSDTAFISSSAINEMEASGVDISPLVPEVVARHYTSRKKK
ncbi:MAG: pantetheine-phosphate adenylyltransferase [Bacillales bacterium]|nr:pantetheine-phosphate adenylyltransferase [Bacillales bacterium]MDY5919805.1 pantetheine-phosphate adenylyltransferase [Candidatus Enteromonas sp.]